MSEITPIHSTNIYRLYQSEDGSVAIVTLPGGDESGYDPSRFVSKPFYQQETAELAFFGYRLLQGDWLTPDDRHKLMMLLH